ncbi:MAG: hypothetical protein ABI999_02560, partial [Acidobacteriota bacterium]
MLKVPAIVVLIFCALSVAAQSARVDYYSESNSRYDDKRPLIEKDASRPADDEVVRVDTDLVTIPVRIISKDGRPVPDVKKSEFKIFENGVEQTIDYFSNEEQP